MLGRTSSRAFIALVSLFALAATPGCGGSYESAWDEPADQGDTAGGDETGEGPSRHDALVAQGDEAWAQRDDPDQIRAAIEAWEQATELQSSDAETWIKLSRAYYFLADGHLRFSEPEQMADLWQTGIRAAERALAALSPEFAQAMQAERDIGEALQLLDERAVPALYWRATNLGKWARADGFATVLSYKDEIRAVMTRCMELDRYYFFAGPDRYFGAFFSIAPTYAGGDVERSRQHFEESIRRFPNYFGTRVLFAEEYAVKSQDRQLYEEQLRYVVDGDPESLPEAAPENRVEQRKAQAALERIDELFE